MGKKYSVVLDGKLEKILHSIAIISGMSYSNIFREALKELYRMKYRTLICPNCAKPYEKLKVSGTWYFGYCENCKTWRRLGTW